MTDLSQRKQIRNLIIQWFEQFSKKDRFTTDDCCRYVNRYMKPKPNSDTVKREMRFLNAYGLISYKPVGPRKEKIIELI